MLLTFQGPGGTLNHLGFALCSYGEFTCSFDPNRTNQVHFVYAINNGSLIDVGGQGGLPEVPISNHQYRFRMDYITCGGQPCVVERLYQFGSLKRLHGMRYLKQLR